MERDRERLNLMALSQSICIGIGLNLGGGDSSAIERPFYTEAEWHRRQAEIEEARDLANQKLQIMQLKMLEAKFNGRG